MHIIMSDLIIQNRRIGFMKTFSFTKLSPIINNLLRMGRYLIYLKSIRHWFRNVFRFCTYWLWKLVFELWFSWVEDFMHPIPWLSKIHLIFEFNALSCFKFCSPFSHSIFLDNWHYYRMEDYFSFPK
jgi:hypothetical protein